MSDKKQEKKSGNGLGLVIPFLVVLGVLTVVSFILPLRPTQSQMEKRNLAEFPEFSLEALVSGDYFDDISTWFSDTFPGREQWLSLSRSISSLHGYSEISIAGDLPVTMEVPQEPVTPVSTLPPETAPEGETAEPTVPTETEGWGGVDAGEDADIEMGSNAVIQIGDAAFNAVGFSQHYSDEYAETVTAFAEAVKDSGITVVSAPSPTAVGILIEPEFLDKLNCARQDEMIGYMHSQMGDTVVKVDTYAALVPHNDEYIYFRTDHHWTARGAYYSYAAICEALGYDVTPLKDFTEWDQGEFEGSLYWKASNPRRLTLDTLIAYVPQGDITMTIYNNNGYGYEGELIQDMTERETNAKYSAFICSDNPLTEITNASIPEGPSCVLIKDSFGNALAPFLAQTYHKVYVVDYRKFTQTTLRWFLKEHEVDDVIFAPYVIATQSIDGNRLFGSLCR
ncbi:MAG: hypothetical protein IJ001_08595 [Oscillospiraceae bacterium]|nr:hypothetical protein [Oscillospiraceae bacterium]